MDIRCPSCETLYEFNENRIKRGSVKLKCSQCGHVFRVEGRGTDERSARHKPGRWMLRNGDDEVLYFQGLTTLQKWIIDRKVGQDDEISRSGKSWKPLGSITELASFFEVADSIDGLQRVGIDPEASQDEPDIFDPMGPDSEEVESPFSDAPMELDISSELAPPRPLEPARASAGSFDDSMEEWIEYGQRSKARRLVLVVIALAVCAGGAWVYLEHPEWLGLGDPSAPGAELPDAGPDAADVAVASADASEVHADVGDSDAERRVGADVEEPDAEAKEVASAPDEKKTKTRKGSAEEGDKRGAAHAADGHEGWIKRGNRALRAGKKQRALESFSAAVRENPGSAEAHRGLGWAYVSLGLSSGAIRSFKAAIRLSPRYGDAYIGLGKAYRMAGNKVAAMKAYERYLSMHPSGPGAYTARYQVERLKGESGAASPSPAKKSTPTRSTPSDQPPPPGATVGPLPDKKAKKKKK